LNNENETKLSDVLAMVLGS